jgi:hypothetical protein
MHKIGALAKFRLLLTGTVITNKPIDVFSQYKFANPAIFGNSFYSFRNRYFSMTGYGKLSHLMDDETPMNVHKAIALGFCDDVLAEDKKATEPIPADLPIPENKTTVKSCYARLNLLQGVTRNE